MPSISAPPPADLADRLEQTIASLWWRLTREARSDVSRTAASVLKYLQTEGPQRVTALATREHVAQPSMSLLVKRLERRGLVERVADPADRRASRITVTAAGAEILASRAQGRAGWLREQLEILKDDQRERIVEALSSLDALLAEED